MILIVNDDGCCDNFRLLLNYCESIDEEVKFVIPSKNQSNTGNTFSVDKTFNVVEYDKGFVIDGTPVDCVRFGLEKFRPDLIISGVNVGFNIGIETLLQSGTFMGAREGYLNNIKSLSCSFDKFRHLNYDLLKKILDEVLEFNFKLANLNIVSDFVAISSLCDSMFEYVFEGDSVFVNNKPNFMQGTDGYVVFNQMDTSLTILK